MSARTSFPPNANPFAATEREALGLTMDLCPAPRAVLAGLGARAVAEQRWLDNTHRALHAIETRVGVHGRHDTTAPGDEEMLARCVVSQRAPNDAARRLCAWIGWWARGGVGTLDTFSAVLDALMVPALDAQLMTRSRGGSLWWTAAAPIVPMGWRLENPSVARALSHERATVVEAGAARARLTALMNGFTGTRLGVPISIKQALRCAHAEPKARMVRTDNGCVMRGSLTDLVAAGAALVVARVDGSLLLPERARRTLWVAVTTMAAFDTAVMTDTARSTLAGAQAVWDNEALTAAVGGRDAAPNDPPPPGGKQGPAGRRM